MNESLRSDSILNEDYLKSDIKSYDESLIYVKRLIAVAVSNIAYLRALFPEDVFTTKYFDKMNLKIIRPKNNDAKILINWLKGAFDAIEKRYLKTMSISIYVDSREPESVLETYDFNITYNENVNIEMTSSKKILEKIKLNSIRIIRSLMYASESLEELPSKLFMNMRLFYYEEITPKDYEPPGFRPCDFNEYKYEDGKYRIKIGEINCLWHQFNLDINCAKKILKQNQDFKTIEEIQSQEEKISYNSKFQIKKSDLNSTIELNPLNVSIISDAKTEADTTIIKEENSTQENYYKKSIDQTINNTIVTKINDLKVGNNNDQDQSPSYSPILSNKNLKKILCGCKLTDEVNMKLLKCNYCGDWQHLICNGIFIQEENSYFDLWIKDFKHCCKSCYEISTEGRIPTDQNLVDIDEKKVFSICIWRRVLYLCTITSNNKINIKYLSDKLNLKGAKLTKVVEKLVKDEIFKGQNMNKKEYVYEINKKELNKQMKIIFYDPTLKLKELNENIKKKIIQNSSMEVDEIISNSQENNSDKLEQTTKSINVYKDFVNKEILPEKRSPKKTRSSNTRSQAKRFKSSICETKIAQA